MKSSHRADLARSVLKSSMLKFLHLLPSTCTAMETNGKSLNSDQRNQLLTPSYQRWQNRNEWRLDSNFRHGCWLLHRRVALSQRMRGVVLAFSSERLLVVPCVC